MDARVADSLEKTVTPKLARYPGLPFYWDAIVAAASRHQLPPHLVAALVVRESGANADAFVHEKHLWNRYLKKLPNWAGKNPRRVASRYGLLQVRFIDAHLHGRHCPEELFQPDVNLEHGCRRLQEMLSKLDAEFPSCPLPGKLRALVASYRDGYQAPDALRPESRAYANTVLALYDQLQAQTDGTTFA